MLCGSQPTSEDSRRVTDWAKIFADQAAEQKRQRLARKEANRPTVVKVNAPGKLGASTRFSLRLWRWSISCTLSALVEVRDHGSKKEGQPQRIQNDAAA